MALKPIKREKTHRYTLTFLNVKIMPNPPKDSDRYLEVIRDIKKEIVQVQIKGGKTALLRTQFENSEDGVKYVYGMLSKYTKIDGFNWIDLTTMSAVAPPAELPKDVFPNLVETRYVFVPAAHRIAIVHDAQFSISGAHEFFSKAVDAVKREGEETTVIIEKSSDAIDVILQSEAIKYLDINLSYSNADISDAATQWMDEHARETEASEIQLTFKSGDRGSINGDAELVKGALGVAQSNGSADATVIKNGKRQKVSTNDYPRKEKMTDKGSEPKNSSIVSKLLSIFRPTNPQNNAAEPTQ